MSEATVILDAAINDIEYTMAEVTPGFEKAFGFWQKALKANAEAHRLALKARVYAGLAGDIANLLHRKVRV